MIIYNVTTLAEHSIATQWLQWIKEEHIPEMISTGYFSHAVILHLLETDETEGVTYAVQYHASTKNDYKDYLEKFGDKMRNKATEKWGNKIISIRSIMEVVH